MTLGNINIYTLALIFIINAIILVISIKLVVEAADIEILRKYFLASLSGFLLSFIPFQILAKLGNGKSHTPQTFLNMPLYSLIIYYLIILILEAALALIFIKVRKNVIGQNSIKESMDNLPDGICFSQFDGTPLLVNRVMQDISYAVFGNMLANDIACAEDIKNNNIKKEAKILQEDPLVVECLGDIWQIKIVSHKNIKETLAYKISLEWELYQEIKEKNRQIEKINASLKEYQKNVSKYTREKEILQAKVNIHDKIGQALIYFKRYLDMEKKTKEDRDKLVNLWMESLLIFDENNKSIDERSDLEENNDKFEKLIATAKDIGVNVHVKGKIPDGEGDLKLLVEIAHEALNNAIRHGQAKNIWIDLSYDELNISCKISNDGTIPIAPIREKGGLKNIRQNIANCGGKMKIYLDGNFILDITWPKGGNFDL